MKKTSSSVPMNSAAYASGPRRARSSRRSSSRAVTAPVGWLPRVLRRVPRRSGVQRRGWYGTLRRVRRAPARAVLVGALALGRLRLVEPAAAAPTTGTLVLDFTPNAVHVGHLHRAGARLRRRRGRRGCASASPRARPTRSACCSRGRADMAILDIADLALARQQGRDVVGVMALVQQPLAAVIAQRGRRGAERDLEGRRAGVAGLPSDTAVLRSVVAGAGGDPGQVEETTIGFTAVPALLGGRVDAATAFWNAEGVALKQQAPGRLPRVPRRRVRRALLPRARPRASRARRCATSPTSSTARSPRCAAATTRR